MKYKSLLSAALVSSFALAVAQTPAPTSSTTSPAATTNSFTPDLKQQVLDSISDIVTKRAFVPGVDFAKWDEFVAKRKTEIDAATTAAAFGGQINRALRDFGFSHIRLQTPTGANPAGSIVGIGIQAELTPDGIRIVSVRPGSPAFRAGLKEDEVITKIDGAKATDTTQIAGQIGQERTFEIKGTDGKVREVKVTLQRIQTLHLPEPQTLLDLIAQTAPPTEAPATPPASPAPQPRRDSLTWPTEDTAMIRIVSFSGNFNRQQIGGFVKEASKAKNLIIDVRNNGGGAAANMGFLLGCLMPPGTEYGVFINRRMANQYKAANPEGEMTAKAIAAWAPKNQRLVTRKPSDIEPFTGKIAVLINRASGSASEITAAALLEQRNAFVIGTPTAGAVLASVFANLPGGFRMQYPISDYVTPKGVRLEGNPVKPTITVTPVVGGEDAHVKAALEAFSKE